MIGLTLKKMPEMFIDYIYIGCLLFILHCNRSVNRVIKGILPSLKTTDLNASVSSIVSVINFI